MIFDVFCDNNWSHTVTKEIGDFFLLLFTEKTILIKYLKM